MERKAMRAVRFTTLFSALTFVPAGANEVFAQTPKETPKSDAKETAAAELTRTKLLRVKVSGAFTDVRLGDILKEFAAQVDMKNDEPVFWTYGTGFPFANKITITVKEQPLEVALDDVLNKAGGGLGYIIVSKDGDRHDGWVQLTTTGERGKALPPPTAEEEAAAADRLALAKKLIDGGRPASAKPLLEILVKKYAATKAGKEARTLLGMIDK
jgi:hypothetical protein